MNLLSNRLGLAALGLLSLLASCQPDLEDSPKSSAGSADFSTYIAVGNSLTAGFTDNGLYREGQLSSFPALLAQQFMLVGGGSFEQPLFDPAQANGSGYAKITGFTATGTPIIGAETSNLAVIPGSQRPGTNRLAKYAGTGNQNLGVPGIRVADIQTPGYGFNNPAGYNNYFERLLGATNATASYQQYVQERVTTLRPTFFTNWLGNNDVLGYATSGGVAPLTSEAEFTTKYAAITDVLTAGGAKGLVATIPNVTNVPYFTTVNTAAVIAQVNATAIPAALEPLIKQALSVPQTSPLPTGLRLALYVTTGAGTKRLATANDLLVLPAASVINSPSATPTTQPFPNGIGLELPGAPAAMAGLLTATANALANNLVLDATEVTAVQARTTALNTIIVANANRKSLAVFDANAYFAGIARTGLVTNAVSNTTAFVSGNLFGLDGVHPTPRGYAVVANEMIRAINAQYGAAVPGLDPTNYRGVRFP